MRYKKLGLLLTLLTTSCFAYFSWDIDKETYIKYEKEIQETLNRKKPAKEGLLGTSWMLKDICYLKTNFSQEGCCWCEKFDRGQEVEDCLLKAGFKKRETAGFQAKGHCFGVTILFVKYLLSHLLEDCGSCEQIVKEMSSSVEFIKQAHAFSVNQTPDYYSEKADPIVFNLEETKRFFQVLIGSLPDHYLLLKPEKQDPFKIDAVVVYATLKELPNKVMIVTYKKKGRSPHFIAVSTYSKKLCVFDSQTGLYEFSDLETLSAFLGKALQHSFFGWLLSFPITSDSDIK